MRILRPGQKILTIGNPGLRVISPRGGAAIPWYLAGGVSAANCIAAYQPIGAADYAASKVNLANPGTHNATDGAEYPTWNATDGWIGNGSSQYLLTDIVQDSLSWSVAMRFTNKTDGTKYIASSYNYSSTNRRFGFYGDGSSLIYGNAQNIYSYGSVPSSGVAILSGFDAYFDGSDVGDISEGANITSGTFTILARKSGANIAYFSDTKIQALSIYDTALTSYQAAAITTAMNAL